eukprot:TRINITY_DN21095_c0_g2_i1.p1 TRINITY_DN21095_c0_g2~~TRINITY_DN21095_c0_g2_i1.p1  ORF type:complete len:737 (+),score=108.96 TRINITY_DN21095_c0_g2_i1:104-2314(+)
MTSDEQSGGGVDDDAALEKRASELAERTFGAVSGMSDNERAAKVSSLKESILHRLRSQRVAVSVPASSIAESEATAPSVTPESACGTDHEQSRAAVATPPTDSIQIPPENAIALIGDVLWFLDDQVLQRQREHVAAAHAAQKILVGQPADEIKRICPTGGRILGAGAVLRLGGHHHGGYGEADIAYVYRQLSRALHPDKNPTIEEAPDAFKRLRDAADELRKLLDDSRSVLRELCSSRRSVASAEMIERPQGPLFSEAALLLFKILGLTGEGSLPDGAVALASAAWPRFDDNGQDIVMKWYDCDQLIQLYASVPLRAAYDCAQKRYRAQFLCALSRAAQAEASRNDGCIRGTWQHILGQFPEVGIWRSFLDKLKARVWENPVGGRASKWDVTEGPQPSAWGRLWRNVISEVLPPGPEDPATHEDKDLRSMASVLWNEVAEWAESDADSQRVLNLFRADNNDPGETFVWAFLPVADLLLTVGDGMVGLTTNGFVGGSGLRRRFEGALRRARAVAEKEKLKRSNEDDNGGPRKSRKTCDGPTCYILVTVAGNACDMEGALEHAIARESKRYGSVTRCAWVCDAAEASDNAPKQSIALEFERKSDAKNVRSLLASKNFDGHTVNVEYIEKDTFEAIRIEREASPTKILLLKNVVGPGQVDVDFECKILEEARKFGRVRKCIVRECRDAAEESAVQVFLAFRLAADAAVASRELQGKLREGRMIHASFCDEKRFKEEELK